MSTTYRVANQEQERVMLRYLCYSPGDEPQNFYDRLTHLVES